MGVWGLYAMIFQGTFQVLPFIGRGGAEVRRFYLTVECIYQKEYVEGSIIVL